MIQEALIDIFYKSGFILLPLFIIGFFSWVLIVELCFFFIKERKTKQIPKTIFTDYFLKEDFNSISYFFKNKQSIDLIFLKKLYENKKKSKQIIDSLYQETITNQFSNQFFRLSTIKMFAHLAPLLGLLGTVNGMITTFKVIATYGNSNPILMADGISEALLTTQAGLSIAFPLLFIHTLLKNKLSQLKRQVDYYYNEFCQNYFIK